MEEVEEYERESGLGKDAEEFHRYYTAEGWKANGKRVYNWVGLYNNWEEPEKRKDNRPTQFKDSDGIVYQLVNGEYERVRQ